MEEKNEMTESSETSAVVEDAIAADAADAVAAAPIADAAAAARSAVAAAGRIVVKIGTATIARQKNSPARLTATHDPASAVANGSQGGVDTEYIHRVAAQFADLVRAGRQPILVTSGAIGMGARELGITERVTEVRMRQACAAIGQPILMEEYRRAFNVFGLTAAQILVTRDAWDDRASYLNLRATVETLLADKVIPVFNENDCLSTAEIGNAFGDNDRLSAYIASKIDAELLVILSDVDSLYDADPRENPEARPIPYVKELTGEHLAAAGGRGSEFSTGGMKTKLAAVAIARDAGCRVVIAHGREPRIIAKVAAGEHLGTLFDAASSLSNRMRWLKNSQAKGSITIDDGALAAIRSHKSLLPRGVTAISGHFDRGSVVLVNGVANILSNFSSAELSAIIGRKSGDIEAILGKGAPHVVARPEETAFLDE